MKKDLEIAPRSVVEPSRPRSVRTDPVAEVLERVMREFDYDVPAILRAMNRQLERERAAAGEAR
jgi:hypothetical protein